MKYLRFFAVLTLAGVLNACQLAPGERLVQVDTPQPPTVVIPASPTPSVTPRPLPTKTPLPSPSPTSSPVPLNGPILSRENIGTAASEVLKFPATGSGFFWPGGAKLLLLQETAFLQVNLQPLSVGMELPIDAPGNHLAASPDGSRVLVQAGDGGLFMWNALDHSRQPINYGVASFGHFSPDGRLIVLGSPDKIEVTLLDAATFKVVKTLSGFETAAPVYEALVSPANDRVLWHSRAHIAWMDIQTARLGAAYEYQNFVDGLAISQDEKALVVSAGDILQVIFSPGDGSTYVRDLLQKQEGGVSKAAFSPDGQLVAAGVKAKIKIWETADWTQVAELDQGESAIRQVGFSPDGRILASLDQANQLTIWRVR